MTGVVHHQLEAGVLSLEMTAQHLPDLYRIAERQNPKRAFLFVSTVLGRHIPVTPQRHNAALEALCQALLPKMAEGGFFVMGFAETATGLGLGVFRGLSRSLPGTVGTYLPTTRFPVSGHDVWFSLLEAHSHAVDHTVMRPQKGKVPQGPGTTLVLVDDETTTGATFENLALGLANQGLTFDRILLATLNDWSAGVAATRLGATFPGADCVSVSLLQGRWQWQADPDATKSTLPEQLAPECPEWQSTAEPAWGVPRLGQASGPTRNPAASILDWMRSYAIPMPGVSDKMLVIGTGEHAWQPFLVAETLARHDMDVSFITTTRSPVRIGEVVRHQMTFPDHYGIGVEMYLNNVDPADWDHILLFTETGIAGIPAALRRSLGHGWIIDGTGTPHALNAS